MSSQRKGTQATFCEEMSIRTKEHGVGKGTVAKETPQPQGRERGKCDKETQIKSVLIMFGIN